MLLLSASIVALVEVLVARGKLTRKDLVEFQQRRDRKLEVPPQQSRIIRPWHA